MGKLLKLRGKVVEKKSKKNAPSDRLPLFLYQNASVQPPKTSQATHSIKKAFLAQLRLKKNDWVSQG